MKSKRINLLLTIISIMILLSGCNDLIFHHFEFDIQGIEDLKNAEYLTQEKAQFLKVNDVAIYHSIKAGEYGRYNVWISCLAQNKEALSIIKKVSIVEKETEKVIFLKEFLDTPIHLEESSKNKLYEGDILVGYIFESEYVFDTSKTTQFFIEIDVEVRNNNKTETTTVSYSFDSIPYYTSSIARIT